MRGYFEFLDRFGRIFGRIFGRLVAEQMPLAVRFRSRHAPLGEQTLELPLQKRELAAQLFVLLAQQCIVPRISIDARAQLDQRLAKPLTLERVID